MEDVEFVELVIKIPERIYNTIMSTQSYIFGFRSGKSFSADILKAIRTGIPLPKGHGNLIDADRLEDEYGCSDKDIYAKEYIRDAPIIIEADKEDKG